MDELYELKSQVAQLEFENNYLYNKILNLESVNTELHKQITTLAIENSQYNEIINKKKKISELSKKKWKYYHDNKDKIQKILEKELDKPIKWHMIKHKSDMMFSEENSLCIK